MQQNLKMTTAARPTFDPARGGSGARERDLSAMSKQYSSRDLPSHTSLKSRERGQNDPEDIKNRDFRRELEERERAAARERESGSNKRESISSSSAIGSSSSAKKSRLEPANLDADDPIDDSDEGKMGLSKSEALKKAVKTSLNYYFDFRINFQSKLEAISMIFLPMDPESTSPR